jgi:hypothetical protein
MVLQLIENPNKPENIKIYQYRQTLDDDIKKELPLFTVHTASIIRLKYDIAELGVLTGLIMLDLDKIPPEELKRVREYLESNPYVVAVFLSPSGRGLKVIIYSDVTDPALYETAYHYVLNCLQEDQVIGKYLDTGCYNLDRGCFLSYDPEVYRNQNPQQWQISNQIPVEALVPKTFDESVVPSNPVESVVLLDRIYDFYVKSGKSLFNDHQSWKDGGYMFFNFFGEREDLAEHYYRKFSMLSDKYDEKQFDKTVRSIKKRKDKPNSTLVKLMKTCLEEGFELNYLLKEIEISAFYRRYKRVFFNQKALQINDYISEIQFDNNRNLIIISPTNSGKTRYFFDHLQGKRILLVPTKLNVDELVAKYSKPDRPVKGIYEGIQVDSNDLILVGTFDAIQKFNRILTQEEYELWVDEYHHFYTSGDKNFRNEVLNELYASMFAYKRVVLMSGTDLDDDFLFNTQPDPTKQQWYNDKYIWTKLYFEKQNVKQKNLTIVETDDTYASIIERLTHEGLNLIYFNDKERGARFAEIITKGGYAVQLVNADNKSTEEVQTVCLQNNLH